MNLDNYQYLENKNLIIIDNPPKPLLPEVTHRTLQIADGRNAVEGICKGSKLRTHYLHMVVVNNTMRAIVELYNVDPTFAPIQRSFLAMLKRVEARKDRLWFTADKEFLRVAFKAYEEALMALSCEEVDEVMLFVDKNRSDGKWLVYRHKNPEKARLKGKRQRA